MKILVINAGSSSLKYQLIDTENNKMLAKGLCERVGSKDSYIKHGGNYFDSSVLITPDVIKKIESLCTLAPLHNPPALKCINVCQSMAPDMPQVAVFDTSFFQSLPPSAYMYPLPYELCEKHQIRKYGAHGTSHRYIAQRCAALM